MSLLECSFLWDHLLACFGLFAVSTAGPGLVGTPVVSCRPESGTKFAASEWGKDALLCWPDSVFTSCCGMATEDLNHRPGEGGVGMPLDGKSPMCVIKRGFAWEAHETPAVYGVFRETPMDVYLYTGLNSPFNAAKVTRELTSCVGGETYPNVCAEYSSCLVDGCCTCGAVRVDGWEPVVDLAPSVIGYSVWDAHCTTSVEGSVSE